MKGQEETIADWPKQIVAALDRIFLSSNTTNNFRLKADRFEDKMAETQERTNDTIMEQQNRIFDSKQDKTNANKAWTD